MDAFDLSIRKSETLLKIGEKQDTIEDAFDKYLLYCVVTKSHPTCEERWRIAPISRIASCQKIEYTFLTRGDAAMNPIQTTILGMIHEKGSGKVFIAKDFLHLGSREAVDQALSRLARSGVIERLGRGLYRVPQTNPRLGIRLAPDPDEIAQALARQTGSRIAPSGAVAANRLGLSSQVPAKLVYLTDGRSRTVKVGNSVFVVKHVAPKELPLGNPGSTLVFQALRHLGKNAVNEEVVSRLRRAVAAQTNRQQLLEDARYTTDWIADIVRRVATEEFEEDVIHG